VNPERQHKRSYNNKKNLLMHYSEIIYEKFVERVGK